MCPRCKSNRTPNKSGFYIRPSDGKKIQRYKCRDCKKSFSDQTFNLNYRYRKRRINQTIFRNLASGVSQRRQAINLGITRKTVDRRIDRLAEFARAWLEKAHSKLVLDSVQFDEMESWVHTKCKPVTIAIAVDPKTREILNFDLGDIAAKGKLAAISRAKYGPRKCQRNQVLNNLLDSLKKICCESPTFETDKSPHYPKRIKSVFPKSIHITTKGIRGCVVGQSELKKSGWDPLFALNHTYAMIRYNIKRLARKTWTTTKKPSKLKSLLSICACYHNQYVRNKKTPPSIPTFF